MDDTFRIGLFGDGRLGAAIARRLGARVAWQVARAAPPERPVDVAIEVSSGDAVPTRLEWALSRGVPLVIGSTGWQIDDLAARVDQRIGVVVAPNFSLGVALLRRLGLVLARFAARDESLDPYVVEHHRAGKHDAPSGTAKQLAATLLEGCPRKRAWRLGGPLEPHELSVAVLRAGSTYSEHRIGVDSPAEVLELRHEARSAEAFVDGAIAAASWIRSRRGMFTMDDVAASAIDPLFEGLRRGEP